MTDVFGKLNEFLNKEQDDSFNYDVNESSFESPIVATISKDQHDVISIDDTQEAKDKRVGKKRKVSKEALSDPDESFDLTGATFDTDSSLVSCTGKSRRKLADEICAINAGEINLCDDEMIGQHTTSQIALGFRGKRGRGAAAPKARKPRKMSYKKALEIINQPLPDESTNNLNHIPTTELSLLHASSSSSSLRRTSSRSNNAYSNQSLSAVDLTGECELGPQHNTAPLFQNKTNNSRKGKKSNEESIEISKNIIWEEDDEIEAININVRINDSVKKFIHYSNRRFYDLFKTIAESEKVPISSVFFFLDDKRIYPDDTPESIDHRISSIYSCTLMDATSLDVTNRKDKIELKFQSDKWKRPISMMVSRVDKISSFLKSLYEQIGFTPKQISLSFDGESIDINTTPIENEFEGGEILDCRVKI